PRSLRRTLAPLVALTVLAGLASATWSIVVVDTRTGEVAVASATCLPNFPLERWVPVVLVGVGGAAAQSSLDGGATNRRIIFADLQAGLTPEQILDDLLAHGSAPESRQWGISGMAGESATFTGSQAGAAICNVTGDVGGIRYAIQGNVLAGAAVC